MDTRQLYEKSKLKFQQYKELFEIDHIDILPHLENLLFNIPCLVECSNKIKNDRIFSKRLNLWFFDTGRHTFQKLTGFMGKLQDIYDLDTSLFKKLTGDMDAGKIVRFIVGIDWREIQDKSRLKFWVIVRDYPEKIDQCLQVHGYDDSVLDLMNRNLFLFGFDFVPKGASRLKIYPMYERQQITDEVCQLKFKRLLCPRATALIDLCKRVHISFKDKDFKKIIHFSPLDAEQFLEKINLPAVRQVDEKYKKYGHDLKIISMSDEELNHDKLEEVNLYY